MLKFPKWGISHQPLARKYSYLDHRYPGGSAFIPLLQTPRSMPQGGARGQNLGHPWKVFFFFYFSVETTYADSRSDMAQPCDMTCGSWGDGQHDLYFTVQWSCLISWRLFDIWTSYFGIMSQYDPTFDLKINVGHCDLYFMFQWFCLISWRLFHVWTSYFGIISQYDPTFDLKNKCRSLWPIFYGPVILPYILRTIWCMSIILWDYGSVLPDIGPQNKFRSLWPIFHGPVRLCDVLTSYCGIMSQYDPMFDLKSLWPIFHGSMIMPYISRTIWWMSVIFSDNETVWPKLWPQNEYGQHDLYFMV